MPPPPGGPSSCECCLTGEGDRPQRRRSRFSYLDFVLVQRDYVRGYSQALGRDMEHLHFGHGGRAILAFPTSMGRFYQWEDFGMVEALAGWLETGQLQLWCIDSVDGESWYGKDRHPRERVERHLQYERYILDEVLPAMPGPPVTAGTSFGALHALLVALRHPTRIRGFIALSGAFDTARFLDGYSDDDTYFTNVMAFLPGLSDDSYLDPIRNQKPKVIATGEEDPNVSDSVKVARLLRQKGVDVTLDLWPGWSHDWPYWKEMMRRYVQ